MYLSRTVKNKQLLYEKRHDKVILQHDNIRSHVANVKTYLEMLKWEVLLNSPYSPDIVPSDYHLFHLMAHGLTEQHFHSYKDAKKMGQLMVSFKRCIAYPLWNSNTARKMEKVVANDGQYF